MKHRILAAMALALVAAVVLWPLALAAQTAVPDTNVAVGGFYTTVIRPYLFEAVTLFVGAAITWLATTLNSFFGVKIDEKHQRTLHSAAVTGITAAIDKYDDRIEHLTIDARQAVVAAAVRWMMEKAPDAVARFKLAPEELRKLAESKLALVSKAPAAVNPVVAPGA